MLPAPFQGHPLQKRTEVQWDMRAWLHADGGANESMSPQLGIIPQLADPDSCCLRPFRDIHCRNVRRSNGICALGCTQTVAPMSQCLRSLVLRIAGMVRTH